MISDKDYKTCTELKNITPQIIEEWNRETDLSDIKLVRRQIFLCCPLTDTLVPEKTCRGCPHNYGDASLREIYCVPKTERVKSARTRRKDDGGEKENVDKMHIMRPGSTKL
jgi:hypothetical protein